ncbi:MAG: RsmB/NOP family class I SAM-dependent RNA methyltransferase [Clostridia bacterium]|nr:RsmB/NOP family class I SAM-dependent RNA methyltransferase [Clostridia bacterium]
MEKFFDRMSSLLSESELEIFKNEYTKPSYTGVRVNTLKCSKEKLMKLTGAFKEVDVTPFCKDGFYLKDKEVFSGNHPLHHAGAVYFQEPSAMSAATLLAPEKGDKVLDLCAAPGGKSTQLAAALMGTGLIWSNEIVKSRANILLGNFERCGIRNGVVSNADPESLCTALEGYFDKVLVDAPCSGEGMIRRDPKALEEWSVEHTLSCATRQLKILQSAKKALKPGGVLVYSTCTFAYEENEGVIEAFLKANPDFELMDSNENFGRDTLNSKAKRIYPMDGGEGHFAAKLKKKEESCGYINTSSALPTPAKKIPQLVFDFLEDNFYDTSPYEKLLVKDDKVYVLPQVCPDLQGTHLVRAGVFAGIIKKNYFEPEHSLFSTADPENVKRVLDLKLSDPRLEKFLRGEEIPADTTEKGYTLVCAEGIALGFGKVSSGMLKNKYPKGLRLF